MSASNAFKNRARSLPNYLLQAANFRSLQAVYRASRLRLRLVYWSRHLHHALEWHYHIIYGILFVPPNLNNHTSIKMVKSKRTIDDVGTYESDGGFISNDDGKAASSAKKSKKAKTSNHGESADGNPFWKVCLPQSVYVGLSLIPVTAL